jgi:hypothetical protein
MIEKMFIDFRSLLLLAIQCLVQFLLRALFNDKNVSDIRVWNGIIGKTYTHPSFSANERNVHLWQKLTHVLSFLVKKRIFLEGGFNFVNIGPK